MVKLKIILLHIDFSVVLYLCTAHLSFLWFHYLYCHCSMCAYRGGFLRDRVKEIKEPLIHWLDGKY